MALAEPEAVDTTPLIGHVFSRIGISFYLSERWCDFAGCAVRERRREVSSAGAASTPEPDSHRHGTTGVATFEAENRAPGITPRVPRRRQGDDMNQTGISGHRTWCLRLLSIGSVVAFLLLWHFCVAPDGVKDWRIPKTMLSRPMDVFNLFIDKLTNPAPDGETLLVHAKQSMTEAFLGYVLALIVGIPLGLAMGWFKTVRGLFRPLFELIRPIPPVAWIPLTVFWFGIGLAGKVFIIWVCGVVPCVINSYIGVSMSNPTYINMARTYGASDWKVFTTICIPSALPMVFSALQLALVYCWITLVAAELLASDKGIGFLITTGRFLGRTDLVLVGMLAVGLTGAAISLLIDKIEARLLAGLRR